jgi:GNAT superfamily N-acetyltransferase
MIAALADLAPDERARASARIEEIFFAAATDTGAAFFRRWTGYYIEERPGLVLVDCKHGFIDGYLMGCEDSAAAERLYDDLFYYRAFTDCYSAWPGHFHVNVEAHARKAGIGRRLVEDFVARCRERACPGVHLVTAAAACNRAFYEALGFAEAAHRRVAGRELVLLARRT